MNKLGIVAALPAEAHSLFKNKLMQGSTVEIAPDIFLCLSGMGTENANTAANHLLNLNVDALISWGVAGGISTDIGTGELLIAEYVFTDNNKFTVNNAWLDEFKRYYATKIEPIRFGPIASVKTVCADTESKQKLATNSSALAVDMESAAIAETASKVQKPFIIVRAIADSATDVIPPAATKFTDDLGHPLISTFLASLIRHPAQIPDLIKLTVNYNTAIQTLKQHAADLKSQHFLYNNAHFV